MNLNITVFVDGLAPHLTSERLETFFRPYGSVRVIRATSKAGIGFGFGFVVFATSAQAAHAIDVLNGAELMGNRIRVCANISPICGMPRDGAHEGSMERGRINMRHRSRITIQASIMFGGDRFVTEGVVLNLAVTGCAVQSSHSPRLGEYLQLALLVPGYEAPFTVDVAKVRWVQSGWFGAEFLRLPDDDQHRLARLVDEHVTEYPNRETFPGGSTVLMTRALPNCR